MFALLSTAWVVPSLAGPAAAAVVGEHFGWRWVFLGLVPVVIVCGAVVISSVARIPTPDGAADAEGANLRDALLVAVGAGLALAGLDQARLVLVVPMTAVGLALCLTAFRRLTPPGTLRARPGLPATVLVRGVLTFSFFMADAYVTYLISTERGASSIVAPAALDRLVGAVDRRLVDPGALGRARSGRARWWPAASCWWARGWAC